MLIFAGSGVTPEGLPEPAAKHSRRAAWGSRGAGSGALGYEVCSAGLCCGRSGCLSSAPCATSSSSMVVTFLSCPRSGMRPAVLADAGRHRLVEVGQRVVGDVYDLEGRHRRAARRCRGSSEQLCRPYGPGVCCRVRSGATDAARARPWIHRPDPVRHASVITAMQGRTATHRDPQWDTRKTVQEVGNTQLTGRFCWWWQVLDPGSVRLGQRFTEPLASPTAMGKRARVNGLEPSMCGQACGRSLVIPADRLLSAVGAALLVSFPARGHSGA
jgi:hypothetical protein